MIIKVCITEKLIPEYMDINVTELNYRIVTEKLKFEREKILNGLREMKREGIIKMTNGHPKNKKYQRIIDELLLAKKLQLTAIEKINAIFR